MQHSFPWSDGKKMAPVPSACRWTRTLRSAPIGFPILRPFYSEEAASVKHFWKIVEGFYGNENKTPLHRERLLWTGSDRTAVLWETQDTTRSGQPFPTKTAAPLFCVSAVNKKWCAMGLPEHRYLLIGRWHLLSGVRQAFIKYACKNNDKKWAKISRSSVRHAIMEVQKWWQVQLKLIFREIFYER